MRPTPWAFASWIAALPIPPPTPGQERQSPVRTGRARDECPVATSDVGEPGPRPASTSVRLSGTFVASVGPRRHLFLPRAENAPNPYAPMSMTRVPGGNDSDPLPMTTPATSLPWINPAATWGTHPRRTVLSKGLTPDAAAILTTTIASGSQKSCDGLERQRPRVPSGHG